MGCGEGSLRACENSCHSLLRSGPPGAPSAEVLPQIGLIWVPEARSTRAATADRLAEGAP